jgi:hypothetical protein
MRNNLDSNLSNATDSQELHECNVIISWFEGEELKSMNKTVYGDPTEAYMEPDGTTPLDVDEDGITDIDEIDPWNSTTPAVMEFIEHFKNDQEMLDGQFNPFIRESTPPVVINVKVKTHENWETVWVGFIPVPILKRAWAEIDMEMIDVAKFHVTVRISPGRVAEFEGEGHEWFKAELDLYIWEVAGKYKVKIEMVDYAGNELDPPYEEEVDGWFGGVLRMLEALWEFICAVVSAIADAVMKALSFLADLVMAIIQPIIDGVVGCLGDLLRPWGREILAAVGRALSLFEETGEVSDYAIQDIDRAIFLSPIPLAFAVMI